MPRPPPTSRRAARHSSWRDPVSVYNTSGGYLSMPIEEVLENVGRARGHGIGGIKLKVGSPDPSVDLARVRAVREHLGDDVPLMVHANQQWDRMSATRIGRRLEPFGLTWIEEPLDAYDTAGHAALAATPAPLSPPAKCSPAPPSTPP